MDAEGAAGIVPGEDGRHSQVSREPARHRITQGALLGHLRSQVGADSSRVGVDQDADPDDRARLRESTKQVRTALPGGAATRRRAHTHHDDALRQARVGQEINHAQPLGEPQGPEGRRLQGDGVGGGAGWRGRLTWTQRPRLVWGEPGFGRQAAVQVSQLRGGGTNPQRRGG